MGSKKDLDLIDLFERDQIKVNWKTLGFIARDLFDTPHEALEILTKYSQILRKASQGTYTLFEFIETQKRKSGKAVNKIIDENLEKLCPLVRINYDKVAASLTDQRKDKKLKKKSESQIERNSVIKTIYMRYNRMKSKGAKELKDYKSTITKIKKIKK